MFSVIYGTGLYGVMFVFGATDPTVQLLNLISAVVGAILAAGVLYGIGVAGAATMSGLHNKNMAGALGGIGRGLFGSVICLLLLGGTLIAWAMTVGASKSVPVPAH